MPDPVQEVHPAGDQGDSTFQTGSEAKQQNAANQEATDSERIKGNSSK